MEGVDSLYMPASPMAGEAVPSPSLVTPPHSPMAGEAVPVPNAPQRPVRRRLLFAPAVFEPEPMFNVEAINSVIDGYQRTAEWVHVLVTAPRDTLDVTRSYVFSCLASPTALCDLAFGVVKREALKTTYPTAHLYADGGFWDTVAAEIRLLAVTVL